jgi:ABC-type nitrate/sulfonate/bicarbonate transport system substrate-binding protein
MALAVLTALSVLKATSRRNRCQRCGRGESHRSLTIGFVPMIDCAVLIAAHELGLFAKHGLCVTLSRELGWATVREKLLHEELTAAHAPLSIAFAMQCGIATVARPCLTGLILCANGSAITLSRELWEKGVRDAASLKALIDSERHKRTYSFGTVLELSTQNYLLRNWLEAGGINPDRDVRIPIVPSPLIHRGMLDGHLDGYCVAEPWNSIAVQDGSGWVAATSAEIEPGQSEKALLVLEKFDETRREEHLALIAALIEAGDYCEQPSNRSELIRVLAQPRYLDVDEALLRNSLIGPFDTGRGTRVIDDFVTFSRNGANIPNRVKGRRTFKMMRRLRASQSCKALRPEVIDRIFREDLFHEARRRLNLPESDRGDHPLAAANTVPSAETEIPAPLFHPQLALAC